jgi:hypothetical protein
MNHQDRILVRRRISSLLCDGKRVNWSAETLTESSAAQHINTTQQTDQSIRASSARKNFANLMNLVTDHNSRTKNQMKLNVYSGVL